MGADNRRLTRKLTPLVRASRGGGTSCGDGLAREIVTQTPGWNFPSPEKNYRHFLQVKDKEQSPSGKGRGEELKQRKHNLS